MKHPQEDQSENRLDRAVLSVLRDVTPSMDPQLDVQINDQARLEAESDSQHETKWRFPMRQFTRAAIAAAAVVLVVFGGFSLFPKEFDSRAAFAQMLEQVRSSSAVAYKMTIHIPDIPPLTGQVYAKGNRIRIIFKDNGFKQINITDHGKGKMLVLNEATRQATLYEVGKMGENEPTDLVSTFRNWKPEATRFVGREKLDEQDTLVYEFRQGAATSKVWVSTLTRSPVRTEMSMFEEEKKLNTVVCTDFDWNPPVTEQMFSLDTPEGYQVQASDLLAAPTEQQFILTLRIYAAFSNKPLPQDLTERSLGLVIGRAAYDLDLSREQNYTRQKEALADLLPGYIDDPQRLQRRIDELCMKVDTFITGNVDRTGKWMGGVKPGNVTNPLCWWKLKDTEKYRVLYGDFTVRDVEQDNLPVIP